MNVGKDGVVYYCRRPEGVAWNEHEAAMDVLKRGFLDFFQTEFREEAIQRNEYGKPYYSANPNLKFNISHCREGVAVALSDCEVGVDVESMRRVNGRVVKKCCSREEMVYVFGERSEERGENLSGYSVASKKQERKEKNDVLQNGEAKRFLILWTLKESYVKMTGEGLRVPFARVCFWTPDLKKKQEKGISEVKGFDGTCRHYLYSLGNLTLALTVQWKEREGEPDFVWRECSSRFV